MDIVPIENWFEEFEKGPLHIAGPCSAESEDQLMQIAAALAGANSPAVFRAGIWKPRTRPGSFNGVGNKGLRWLARVKREFGFRIAVEAASAVHVEQCIDAGVDIIWVGARSVSNPFSVDEIASSLQGIDMPVFIKNPLNPDIDLWIGAIERIYGAGIRKIAAIHRGFSPFERTLYRNIPKWEIPIELRRRINNIPLLCDPSHITGDSSLVYEVSQKAMDLNMDGLMVEVHSNPPEALSDCNQQITPDQYRELMEKLMIRKPKFDDPGFLNDLEELRNQVDSIDHQFVELLSERMKIIDRIADYKFSNNVSVLQMERWLEILKTRTEHGDRIGIDSKFMEQLLKHLHQESIRRQTDVMIEKKKEANGLSDKSVTD